VFRVLIAAWILMLALSSWHHRWPLIPPLGYYFVLPLVTVAAIFLRARRRRLDARRFATPSFYHDGSRYRRR
jgi:hypothetical protein